MRVSCDCGVCDFACVVVSRVCVCVCRWCAVSHWDMEGWGALPVVWVTALCAVRPGGQGEASHLAMTSHAHAAQASGVLTVL